ncbi:DEAD/DEAH box helicase [Candidatus Bathyarchaeota archaeon]|nr:DEAD/DEAH box helicase [Candidatus Bathyarchaeota archaeon]
MRIDELPIPEDAKRLFLEEGIRDLYPPQEEAFRKTRVLEGGNLLMASPTASGKTLVAEVCALKHIIEGGGKVVYTTPLRALASEKFTRFKRYEKLKKLDGGNVRVTISTGDYDSSDPWLSRYDWIVTTYEKLDSLLRHGAPWVKDVTLLVVDEVHYLGQGDRGPTLEVLLTRFRMLNPKSQIIALSATVRNVEELARWFNADYTATEWRPVTLKEGIYLDGVVRFSDGTVLEVEDLGDPIVSLTYDVIKRGGQILVFTETRKKAVSVARKLSKTVEKLLDKRVKSRLKRIARRIVSSADKTRLDEALAKLIEHGTAFHHAGLRHERRTLVEEAFRKGYVKALAATPTLAAGVNLPARRVVLASYERYEPGYGRTPISVMEYKQMCLPYEAEILLADGTYAKIGELIEKGIKPELTALSEKNFKLRSNRVIKTYTRHARQLIELKVQHGEVIRVTPEHPILTRRGWMKAEDVEIGDMIAHITRIPYSPKMPKAEDILPKNTYVLDTDLMFNKWVVKVMAKNNLKKKDIAKMLNVNYKTFLSWENPLKRNVIPFNIFIKMAKFADCGDPIKYVKVLKTPYGKPIKFNNIFSEDFLWFAGIVASDGNLNQRDGTIKIRVFNTDRKIIDRVCYVLKKLGLNYRLNRVGNTWTVECSNMLLGHILTKFGIPTGKKSNRLYISDIVKNMPKTLLASYVAGVFDGDGNYTECKAKSTVRSIRIHSKSGKFIRDLKEVLLKLGVVSHLDSRFIDCVKTLRGKKAHFKGMVYGLIIRSNMDIKRFFEQISPVRRISYDPNVIRYKIGSGEVNRRRGDITWSKIVDKRVILYNKPIKVYNIEVTDDGNYVYNNLVVHNCGRAGRPGLDPVGEAVLIARSEDELEFLMERYVYARPERIWSNLGAEPFLRPHVLSSIATGVAYSVEGVLDFFSKTLYAYQMGVESIADPIRRILDFLEENGFIRVVRGMVEPTALGKRVSELYIDPLSAAIIIDGFERRRASEVSEFGLLHLVNHTPDASPKLYPRRREVDELIRVLELRENELLVEVPDRFSEPVEFEALLGEIKMTLVIMDWINEVSENTILDKYGVEPGDLYRLVSSVNWLLYAAQELSKLMGFKRLTSKINILRNRVEKGVREELLTLTSLEGIGRVRARALYQAGYRTLEDLRRASLEELMRIPTIGGRIAKRIKEQVGGTVSQEALKAAEDAGVQKTLTDYSRHRSP